MAIDYHIKISAHPSVHQDQKKERKIEIYFSEPDLGVNKETGILLLISGFGAHANSKVYKKMRSVFADKYNLVTVQCNYFGYEFMQSIYDISTCIDMRMYEGVLTEYEISQIFKKDQFDIQHLLQICSKYQIKLEIKTNFNETLDNFNDMSIMQTLDCLNAVLSVMAILRDNQYTFNARKILIYGHSHGSYLAYLCNAFSPKLFTLLIDNSAWLFPAYLKQQRGGIAPYGDTTIKIIYEYLAAKMTYDEELLYLPSLYKISTNNCRVICYQGCTDNLVNPKEKQLFCDYIGKCSYLEIDQEKVDYDMIKSTDHGLDADFLKLFDYSMRDVAFEINSDSELTPICIETKCFNYCFEYINNVLILSRSRKT